MWGKVADIDLSSCSKLKEDVTCGEKFDRWQHDAFKRVFLCLYRLHQTDAQVHISPLQHGKLSRTHRFDHLDLYVRPAFSAQGQESGKHPVEHLRRRRHPQQAGVSSSEQLTSLVERPEGA